VSPISSARPLLLGSASPRRRELLAQLGVPTTVFPAEIVERVAPEEPAESYLERIVLAKLAAVRERARGVSAGAVLVADTEVIVDGVILGKPASLPEAERMLSLLAGRSHEVCTRYGIAAADAGEPWVARSITTRVIMRKAPPQVLSRYAATGEGLDKAGAYGVQGVGAFLVERIEGSYANVVGLPICEVMADFERLGLVTEYP
jgi:septum formation protein